MRVCTDPHVPKSPSHVPPMAPVHPHYCLKTSKGLCPEPTIKIHAIPTAPPPQTRMSDTYDATAADHPDPSAATDPSPAPTPDFPPLLICTPPPNIYNSPYISPPSHLSTFFWRNP